MASTNQINKVVELIVVLGDLIILNFCLFLLLFYWEKAFNSLPFSCTASLMMTSLSLCYLACSASRGRAWNSREIRADQLVLRVLKNSPTMDSIAGTFLRITRFGTSTTRWANATLSYTLLSFNRRKS